MKSTSPGDAALAAILRGHIARTGMKQSDFTARSGLSQSTLTRILAGTKPVSVTQMYAMAEVLGVSAQELVAEVDKEVSRGR